jgi:hypothetical protein
MRALFYKEPKNYVKEPKNYVKEPKNYVKEPKNYFKKKNCFRNFLYFSYAFSLSILK